ncbi:MAG: hypothetical protein IKA44_02765 [Clostridia bacterium]|nr:hypothetical protein [Clostridia bacterium]
MKILFRTLIGCALLLLLPATVSCDSACQHTYATVTVTAPTCDKEGYTLHQCTQCAYQYKTDFTPPTGHTLSETVFAPTCDKEGYTYSVCDCGYAFRSDFTPPTGHVFSEETVLPTCSAEGYVRKVCSVCQVCYETDLATPSGHTFDTAIQRYPTRTQNGLLLQTCACGYRHENPFFYSDIFEGGYANNTAVLARGVDVSVYQHKQNAAGDYLPLNWSAIQRAGFEFAILKAGSTPRINSEGEPRGGMDPVFEQNYAAAKEMGMELGVYFYTYATTKEGIETDARLLVSWLEGKQFEYPVYFDLEDKSLENLDRATLTDFCVTFLSILQENGYYGALYSNHDWLTERLNGEALKSAFDIWYARYPEDRRKNERPVSVSEAYAWNTEKYESAEMGLWQYTDYGVIDGIDGIFFDFNYAFKDYSSIIKKYGYNGYEWNS